MTEHVQSCTYCKAKAVIDFYGEADGIQGAKIYMKRFFKLSAGCKVQFPKSVKFVNSKIAEIQDAISIIESGKHECTAQQLNQ